MISRPLFLKASCLLALVLLLGTFASVLASASGPADRDLSVDAAGGTDGFLEDDSFVRVLGAGLGACTPSIAGAFSIDVSSPDTTHAVDLATLTLAVAGSGGSDYPLTLKLFAAKEDITESPVTTTALSNLIGADLKSSVTLTETPTNGDLITFQSSPEFVQEANLALTGDKRLTVLVELTACGGTNAVRNDWVDFRTHESGTAPQFYFEGPLGVTLSAFSVDKPASTWPLYAGLGAVALILVAGLAISRRRTA